MARGDFVTGLNLLNAVLVDYASKQAPGSLPPKSMRPSLFADGGNVQRLTAASIGVGDAGLLRGALHCMRVLQDAHARNELWDEDEDARLLPPSGIAASIAVLAPLDPAPDLLWASARLASGRGIDVMLPPTGDTH